VLGLVPVAASAAAAAQGVPPAPFRFLGEFVYPHGTTFEGTAVGELSGLTYDPRRGVFYAVSDDRSLAGAQDVAALAALPFPFAGRTATKNLLVNLRQAGITPDNLEAMTLGPRLASGAPSLLLMSDDNLSASQRNQFLLFELGAPVAPPRTGAVRLPAAVGPAELAAAVAGLVVRATRRAAARVLHGPVARAAR
jgi:hypothetical protein